MYNEAEYQKLITRVSHRCKRAKLNLTITNLHTHTKTSIILNARNKLDDYDIVFDPDHSDSPINYPESYYCNTYTDFKSILLFILKHQRIFVTKTKYDLIDLDCILSLDELLENDENFDIADKTSE